MNFELTINGHTITGWPAFFITASAVFAVCGSFIAIGAILF
jgi:hypothetical protein